MRYLSSFAVPRLAQRLLGPLVIVLAGLSSAAHAERGIPRSPPVSPVADAQAAQVIVKYKALGTLMRAARAAGRSGPQHAGSMMLRTGLALTDGRVIDGRSQVLRGDKSLSSTVLAARLAADPEVEYAVPDGRRYALAVPNDPLYPAATSNPLAAGQWYLRAPDSTLVSAINAVGAWSVTTGSASVVVADIDTGVLVNHPDLANKLLPGYDFITSTAGSGDGGARDADASDPGDWTIANQCNRGAASESSSWHGSQTSSIIGAQTGNGVGMASVGNGVMLLPVRVLGHCGGTDSDIIAAMLWAAGVSANPVANPYPAKVLNLSLGGSGACSSAYADAIAQINAAGAVVVVAAGNDEGLAVSSPANCAGAIAVAGVRHSGTKVGFSSIGPQVAIAAPGGNCVNSSGACLYPILTATNSSTTTPSSTGNTYSDSSNYSVGTSFATPMVAGAAALMFSVNPSLTPAQVKSHLMSSARAFPTPPANATVPQCVAPTQVAQDECYCTTSTCGAGLLDVAAAVSAAATVSRPIAAITASVNAVLAGGQLALDGRASSTATGRTITAYQWALTSGATIAGFSGGTSASTATLLTSGVGSVTVQLTVTDSAGQQATATSTLTVNAPAAPTVSLLASATVVPAGGSLTLDGSASKAASGLSLAAYQWAIISGGTLAHFTTSTNAATASLDTLGSASGVLTVQLTVTDSLGQTSSTSTTINVAALSPTAAISTPSASVVIGSSVVFDGSGSLSPAGRTIAAYQWSLLSGNGVATLSSGATASSATFSAVASGSFTVRLTVTDSAGVQSSQTSTVTVTAAPVAVVTTTSGTSAVGGGGGGGGGASPAWVLGLAAAVLALARAQRRREGDVLPGQYLR